VVKYVDEVQLEQINLEEKNTIRVQEEARSNDYARKSSMKQQNGHKKNQDRRVSINEVGDNFVFKPDDFSANVIEPDKKKPRVDSARQSITGYVEQSTFAKTPQKQTSVGIGDDMKRTSSAGGGAFNPFDNPALLPRF
jgi:hypothetical protein